MKEKELKWEIECQLNEITRRNGKRTCPLCGNELIVNYEGNGYYYNCSNNVNCRYTEIIVLED